MKKRYFLTYDFMGCEVVVDIDHGILTDERLHEINSFWSGAEERLTQADGNVLHAVLKMLCCRLLADSIQVFSVMQTWTKDAPEGWPNLDGSYGITLVGVDDWTFDEEEVSIKVEEVPS